MQEDDFADATQQLLDAIDLFLNSKVVDVLGPDDRDRIRFRRGFVATSLDSYRSDRGYTERRQGPTPARKAAVSAIALLPTAGAATMGNTARMMAVSDAIAGLLDVAGIVLVFSQYTDGGGTMSAYDRFQVLKQEVQKLTNELTNLQVLASSITITAESVKTLGDQELVNELVKAIGAGKGLAVVAILGELARRFPKCKEIIDQVGIAERNYRHLTQTRGLGTTAGQALIRNALDKLNTLLRSLLSCMASPP